MTVTLSPPKTICAGDLVVRAQCLGMSERLKFFSPERALLVLQVASWSVSIGRPVRHVELLDPATGRAFWSLETYWQLLCRAEG